MDKILLLLFKYGAGSKAVSLSTPKIGRLASMSQQNASRRIIELEASGKLSRSGGKIALTPAAVGEIRQLYIDLKSGFERSSSLKFNGSITSGLKEGAYYLSLPGYKNTLKKALGFAPFPGTLNLKLDSPPDLPPKEQALFIPGFEWKGRHLGGLYAYRCIIGSSTKLDGAIIQPIRTHHGKDVVELVAPVSVKQKLKKKDGDRLLVTLS